MQALRFRYCDQLSLSGFTSLNSPKKHIMIHGSSGVDISSIHVNAPQHSPNTDGIVLSGSTRVNIFKSVFRTGNLSHPLVVGYLYKLGVCLN